MSNTYLINLAELIESLFDTEELRSLCFHLDIEYDDLRGEGRVNKIRELLKQLQRHDRIVDLIESGQTLRPKIEWPLPPVKTPNWINQGITWLKEHAHYLEFNYSELEQDAKRLDNLTLYQKGRKHIKKREYARAVAYWVQLHNAEPSNTEYELFLRICLDKINREINLKQSLEQTIRILIAKASSALVAEDFSDAEKYLNEALERDPDKKETIELLKKVFLARREAWLKLARATVSNGRSAIATKDYTLAISYFEHVMTLYDKNELIARYLNDEQIPAILEKTKKQEFLSQKVSQARNHIIDGDFEEAWQILVREDFKDVAIYLNETLTLDSSNLEAFELYVKQQMMMDVVISQLGEAKGALLHEHHQLADNHLQQAITLINEVRQYLHKAQPKLDP